jgi:hypothetical protein
MKDPRRRLNDYQESMISLARNGPDFHGYAAREILRGNSSHLDLSLRVDLIRSALNRHDEDAVRVFVNDWADMGIRGPKSAMVSRWVPGDHFYALDEKFESLYEAIQHLKNNGYKYSGITERHVYKHDGD